MTQHQLVDISEAVKFTGMSKKDILKALTSYKQPPLFVYKEKTLYPMSFIQDVLNIEVISLDDKCYKIPCSLHIQVKEIKELICKVTGYPDNIQKLLCNGVYLKDENACLYDYYVSKTNNRIFITL